MSFSRLLGKFSQPSFADSDPTGAGSSPHWQASADDPDDPPQRRDASESTPTTTRPWRKKRSSAVDHSTQSQLASTTPLIPKVESPTSDGGMTPTTPLPTTPGVFLTNLAVVPSPDMIAIGAVPDTLSDAWEAVKDNPKIPNVSRELDAVGALSATRPHLLSKLIPEI
jgi:hypothetical protein